MRRDYTFIADTDSLDALRRLRGGWAGWALVDGEVHVRLRDGGTVRAHVDRGEIEPDFEVSCLVADWWPGVTDPDAIPAVDSPFTSQPNEVLVFRGVTWLEPRPDLGPDHTIQYSAIPGYEIPETARAKCDFTDAVAVVVGADAVVVRLALKPGHLEVVTAPEDVSRFLELRGVR